MSRTRRTASRLSLTLGSTVAALALTASGCGKDPNTTPRSFLHFSHTLPEAPRAIVANPNIQVQTWTAGGPIVIHGDELLAVDQDNGALVRIDAGTLAPITSVPVGKRPEQVVTSPSGDVFVSLRDSGEVVRLDGDLNERARVKLGLDVHGLALSPDGSTLYATLPFDGVVVGIDVSNPTTMNPVARVEVGELPRGLAFAPDASANRLGALVVAMQAGGAVRVPVDTQLRPMAAETHELVLRDANPSEFKLSNNSTTFSRARRVVPTRALAVAVHPETGAALVAHALAAPGEPERMGAITSVRSDGNTMSSDGYGSSSGVAQRDFAVPVRPVETTISVIARGEATASPVEASLAIRDDATGEPMTHLVDQPSDIRHHPTTSLAFVTGFGTDNVIVFSTAEGDPMRSPVAIIDVGRAPRGLAFSADGSRAFVLNSHDFTVSAIDLTPLLSMPATANRVVTAKRDDSMGFATEAVPVPSMGVDAGSSIAIADDPTPDSLRVRPLRLQPDVSKAFATDPWPSDLREGARIFSHTRNESISHAGQFACATCHFEGTEDKLAWVTPDGVRQTIALAGRLNGTGPFNWNGSEDALQSNMNKTIARMGGEGLTDAELVRLERFLLEGLPSAPNPNRMPNGTLTPEQELGRAVFNDPEVGCANCHRPDNHFVDGFRHDVGTVNMFDLQRWELEVTVNPELEKPGRMNTPSLKDLFYTAPYLHDGSAPDLMAVLERTRDTMGRTSHLSPEELEALVAYLKTL